MIRLPVQNDLIAIGRVYCDAWKAAYRGIVPDEFLNGLTDESCAPHFIPPKGALICEMNGVIAGAASFGARRNQPQPQAGELYSIYVLPEYWHIGIGRALFEAVSDSLRADGYSSLFLWTMTDNLRARCFYQKMGMTEVSSRTIAIGGKDLSETGYHQTLI